MLEAYARSIHVYVELESIAIDLPTHGRLNIRAADINAYRCYKTFQGSLNRAKASIDTSFQVSTQYVRRWANDSNKPKYM